MSREPEPPLSGSPRKKGGKGAICRGTAGIWETWAGGQMHELALTGASGLAECRTVNILHVRPPLRCCLDVLTGSVGVEESVILTLRSLSCSVSLSSSTHARALAIS